MLISNYGSATSNNVAGLVFEVSADGYASNAGTGICAVKNGTASDYGADLAFITRPQSAVAEERMRIDSSGNVGIGTIGPVSSGYDTGSKKLTVMSTTLNNATSGYLELASRANTAGYNAGAIQFNNFENAGTAGSGTQNRTCLLYTSDAADEP